MTNVKNMADTKIEVVGLIGFRIVKVNLGAAPYKADSIIIEKDGVTVRLRPEMNYMVAKVMPPEEM